MRRRDVLVGATAMSSDLDLPHEIDFHHCLTRPFSQSDRHSCETVRGSS